MGGRASLDDTVGSFGEGAVLLCTYIIINMVHSELLLSILRFGTLDQVVAHVEANPECLREKDAETGRLVLHDALADCRRYAEPVSLDKIQHLIITCPQSLCEKDAERLHATSCCVSRVEGQT